MSGADLVAAQSTAQALDDAQPVDRLIVSGTFHGSPATYIVEKVADQTWRCRRIGCGAWYYGRAAISAMRWAADMDPGSAELSPLWMWQAVLDLAGERIALEVES